MKLIPQKLIPIIVLTLLAFGSTSYLSAADRYMTVSGAGSKNGTSWAHAYASSTMATVVNTTMQNGDTLYLSGPETSDGATYGDLRFTITSSGTSDARKSLIGVDRGFGLPHFVGSQGTRSYTTITLGPGVSYWTIKDLTIERREMGIASSSGAARVGLIIDGVTVRNTSSKCFSFTNCDDLLVVNCRAERYSRIGFMFNHSCDGVIVRDSVADCTGTGDVPDPSWKSSVSSPVGFNFHIKNSSEAPNTNILLEDCEALNNDEDTASTSDFEQGDGFKMEGKNDNVTFRRCIAHSNQDAGYDLKGTNQVLDDCLALNNRRYGFKLWYSGTLTNCISVNNLSRQFTLPATTTGNMITANACTFHSASNSQSGAVIEKSGNTMILNDCIISFAGTAGSYTAGSGTFTLNGTVKRANASNTVNSPKYVNPTLPWDGAGTNFDSLTYGLTKGYNSQSADSIIVVVDNADSTGVTVTGSWTTSTSASGYYGTNYMHDGDSGKGSKSIRFTPTIPETGSYEVFAWWISSANRASNVPIDIVHASGTSTIQVDQRSNGSQLVSLGSYTFNSGTDGSVLIRNTGTNGYVMADAVAFVKPAVEVVAQQPYQQWLEQFFSEAELEDDAIVDDTADPDDDGLSNLLEYALGGGPKQSSDRGMAPAFSGTNGELVLHRIPTQNDLTLELWASEDLVGWELVATSSLGGEFVSSGAQPVQINDDGGNPATVSLNDPRLGERKTVFYSLKVSREP